MASGVISPASRRLKFDVWGPLAAASPLFLVIVMRKPEAALLMAAGAASVVAFLISARWRAADRTTFRLWFGEGAWSASEVVPPASGRGSLSVDDTGLSLSWKKRRGISGAGSLSVTWSEVARIAVIDTVVPWAVVEVQRADGSALAVSVRPSVAAAIARRHAVASSSQHAPHITA